MAPDIQVRPGLPGDARVFCAMVASLSAEEGVMPPGFTPAIFRRDGFGPDRKFQPLLAEWRGRPAGIALLTRGYDTQSAVHGVVLEDLYVEPGSRRQGVGTALIRQAVRIARDEGGGWVAWHVRTDNARAQLFYRALGAEVEPVHLMALAGDGFTALLG